MKPSLVLQVAPWELSDERTGEKRRGYSVYYVDMESPLVGNKRGFDTLRISCPESVANDGLREVPGFYDLRFRQRPGRNGGKVELSLAGMSFVEPFVSPGE